MPLSVNTGKQYSAPTLRTASRFVALAACLLAAACSGDNSPAGRNSGWPRAALERGCSTHVEGRLPGDWRQRSVVAGPLAFYPARTFEDEHNPDPRARFVEEKTLVVVRAGRRATVSAAAARAVSLDYDFGRKRAPRSATRVRLSDGLRSVMFTACPRGTKPLSPGHPLDRQTQFNGGIIGRWGRCLPLDVVAEGEAPLRVKISFGAGRCPAGRRP
jgi:hypothetical protein